MQPDATCSLEPPPGLEGFVQAPPGLGDPAIVTLQTEAQPSVPVQDPGLVRLRERISHLGSRSEDTGAALSLSIIAELGASQAIDAVVAFLGRLTPVLPASLHCFSTLELSDTLVDLAILSSTPGCRPWAEQLALRIILERSTRPYTSSIECAANVFAVGTLRLRGKDPENFTSKCFELLSCEGQICELPSRDVASCLWASQYLRPGGETLRNFCVAAARELSSSKLASLSPAEISALISSCARLLCKCTAKLEVTRLAISAVEQAARRITEFGPLALSQMAASLVSMDLCQNKIVKEFLVTVAARATPIVAHFPPKAITNLCWSLCQVRDDANKETIVTFLASAVAQAGLRSSEFEWSDREILVQALATAIIPEVRPLAWLLSSQLGMMQGYGDPYAMQADFTTCSPYVSGIPSGASF